MDLLAIEIHVTAADSSPASYERFRNCYTIINRVPIKAEVQVTCTSSFCRFTSYCQTLSASWSVSCFFSLPLGEILWQLDVICYALVVAEQGSRLKETGPRSRQLELSNAKTWQNYFTANTRSLGVDDVPPA